MYSFYIQSIQSLLEGSVSSIDLKIILQTSVFSLPHHNVIVILFRTIFQLSFCDLSTTDHGSDNKWDIHRRANVIIPNYCDDLN